MLDAFEIITTSGVVLWSRSNASIGPNSVNSLINDVFIEEKVRPISQGAGHPTYRFENYTLKWTLVKDLGLIFVAVYQSILSLSWVDKLLDNIRTIFVSLYKTQLAQPNATVLKYPFDPYFDQQLQELDKTTGGAATKDPPRIDEEKKRAEDEDGDTGGPPPPLLSKLIKPQPQAVTLNGDSAQTTPIQSPDSSRPTTPIPGHLVIGKGGPAGRGSRRTRKAANISGAVSPHASGDDTRPKDAKTKKGRKWTADGLADEEDDVNLDYSVQHDESAVVLKGPTPNLEVGPKESWGSKTKAGHFVLKDLDDEINHILRADAKRSENGDTGSTTRGSALGTISGYFRNIVGGKTLTKEDLENPLKAMEDHLIQKNVARDAALRICDGVEKEMVGKKTGAFENVDRALKPALETTLRKILTPRSSLDLLREIDSVRKPANMSTASRPFVISVVGTNGTGKSTNLSKICYLLMQNDLKVVIAAGDTFRSGAVEQLNVHVRNLKELSTREGVGDVELFSKGYSKDAAHVARDAVAYAAANDFDVCLIDTAGRAHTNTTLMSSLEKFAELAKPDKIFMVGEALAGSDLLGQAHDFSRAFGPGRTLDGFIISKVDTVDANVGALVSVVHSTGIPIVFVGVGQTYQDLRNFSVGWAVDQLMRP